MLFEFPRLEHMPIFVTEVGDWKFDFCLKFPFSSQMSIGLSNIWSLKITTTIHTFKHMVNWKVYQTENCPILIKYGYVTLYKFFKNEFDFSYSETSYTYTVQDMFKSFIRCELKFPESDVNAICSSYSTLQSIIDAKSAQLGNFIICGDDAKIFGPWRTSNIKYLSSTDQNLIVTILLCLNHSGVNDKLPKVLWLNIMFPFILAKKI